MKNTKTYLTLITTLLLLSLVAAFYYLSQVAYLADSEIWLMTQSHTLWSSHPVSSVFYKPVFHVFNWFFSFAAPSEWSVFLWARWGWASLSLMSLLILSLAWKSLLKETTSWLFMSLVFVMTCHLSLSQLHLARGDTLALFFHSLFMWLMQRQYKQAAKHPFLFLPTLILINGLLLGSTPKGIFLIAMQFLFWSKLFKLSPEPAHRKLRRDFHIVHLLPLILISGLFSLSPLAPSLQSTLMTPIQDIWLFFINSFSPNGILEDYTNWHEYFYLIVFWQQSPVHALSFLAFLIWVVVSGLRQSLPQQQQPLWSATTTYVIMGLVAVMIHNDRLPFFLAMILVPLLFPLFGAFGTFFSLNKSKQASLWLAAVLFVTFYFSVQHLQLQRTKNNNFEQKRFMTLLDRYTEEHPHLRIYDVIGLLPRKNKIYAYIGPGLEQEKNSVLERIQAQNPDVILLTNKAKYLQPLLRDWLKTRAYGISDGIYLRGFLHNTAHQKKSELLDRMAKEEKDLYRINLETKQWSPINKKEELSWTNTSLFWMISYAPPFQFETHPELLFRYNTGF